MNIQVDSLDGAFDQIKVISDNVTKDGGALLQKLEGNIGALKNDWVGSDATLHINHLIDIYDALVLLLGAAKEDCATASEKIIAIQQIRFSNSGNKGRVDTKLSAEVPQHSTIEKLTETGRYYVDANAANDSVTLGNIIADYSKFMTAYETDFRELLDRNWKAGANWQETNNHVNEYVGEYSSKYKSYIDTAKQELDKAIKNIQQIAD